MPGVSDVEFETLDHNLLSEFLKPFLVRILAFLLLLNFLFNLFDLVLNLRIKVS